MHGVQAFILLPINHWVPNYITRRDYFHVRTQSQTHSEIINHVSRSILKSKLCYSKTAFRRSKLRRTEKVLGSTTFINNM